MSTALLCQYSEIGCRKAQESAQRQHERHPIYWGNFLRLFKRSVTAPRRVNRLNTAPPSLKALHYAMLHLPYSILSRGGRIDEWNTSFPQCPQFCTCPTWEFYMLNCRSSDVISISLLSLLVWPASQEATVLDYMQESNFLQMVRTCPLHTRESQCPSR